MELNFSNKGLISFDASHLGRSAERLPSSSTAPSDDAVLAGLLERAPIVKGINLSQNAIRVFIGGERLRHVTRLDLSSNAISVLNASSLPPRLVRLSVAHNNLRDLGDLNRFLPNLQELNISFNAFTSSGLRDLPLSLTSLNAQNNDIESLNVLRPLRRLAHLNVACNGLNDKESIEGLRDLTCLHHIDLTGNDVMNEGGIALVVNEMAPRLVTLNGEPVSQSANNSKYKAKRAASVKATGSASSPSSANVSVRQSSSQLVTRSATRDGENGSSSGSLGRVTRSRVQSRGSESGLSTAPKSIGPTPRAPPMEIRLMEAKVAELRRLLTEAEKREAEARGERALLIDQIKGCAGTIDAQARELECLLREVEALQKEERAMRDPVAQVDHTFEQTHASLIAQKVDIMSGSRAGREDSTRDVLR